MQTIGRAKRVIIYIGESDKWERKPLHMAILELLKREACAGATVTRALAGFGAHSQIKTASLVELSADLPLKIEWVDNPARVERVMPHLRRMVKEGLITVEDVEVVFYSHRDMRHLSAFVPVQDVMTRQPVTVAPDTPVAEVVERLIYETVKTLLVVDKTERLVGIITDGDVLNKIDLLVPGLHRHLTETELAAELKQLRQLNLAAQDIMTPHPATVTLDTTIPKAVDLMLERNIKRLPVVDEHGTLIGIVSRVDVLRAFAKPLAAEVPRQAPVQTQRSQVKEVMAPTVSTVRRDAVVAEIVALLVSNRQRRVVVVDRHGQVVGIITDGDLLKRATPTERSGIIETLTRRLAVGQTDDYHLRQRTAAEVMTTPVVIVAPESSLVDALQLLLENGIKRLPVIDAEGQLVGLIGRGGILQALGQVDSLQT
jgi:CBS-domain-containing membrane protein